MVLEIKQISKSEDWKDFIDGHKYNYFLQSWEWGEFQSEGLSKKVFRLAFTDRSSGKVVGMALCIEEESRFGKYIYIPRGPVLDWENEELATSALTSLLNHFNNSYISLKVEPFTESADTERIFREAGFVDAARYIQGNRMWIVDLAHKTEEELLKDMRESWRQSVQKALKLGIQVRISDSDEDFQQFLQMLEKTAQRKGFLTQSPEYLKKEFSFTKSFIKVVTAYEGDTALASALIAFYGNEASYLHAASTEDGHKKRAAYALHWESMKYCQKNGIRNYNLWGVVKEEKYQPKYPQYGYSYFKRGFGGTAHQYTMTKDYPFKMLNYLLLRLQEWYQNMRYGLD